jgi:hypothetical protein
MERRVRQHDAEVAIVRRHACKGRPRGRKHNWARGRNQQGPCVVGQIDKLRGRRLVADHHRKRLLLAELAIAQGRDRGRVRGVAGEVVSTDSLDGNNSTLCEQQRRARNRLVFADNGAGRLQEIVGPAGRARGWLRVKPAAPRIVVFGRAAGAQRPSRHRRVRSVVRKRAKD